ncbi:transporter substrate-binding domain-containing protein [Actinophytocola sp.]|uniref:transporter substrate-binding domain-containing protein n=1 Tax=Actinophytocola sp. TaxID=1872138 RepID=UPI002ED64BE9
MGLSRRQFLLSTTVLGAAAATGCTTAITGSAQPNPADLRRLKDDAIPDEVTVGIIAYRPYTIEEGELTGPVPEIARAVLAELGTTPKFELMRDEQKLLVGIKAQQFDMVAGLTMRSDLCGDVVYSMADHVSGTALAVPPGNPKGLKTYADVISSGAKLAVFTGFPEDTDASAAGVASQNVVRMVFSDPFEFVAKIEGGAADCFAYDDISLRDMVKESGAALDVAPPFRPENRVPFIGAYAFPRESPIVEPFNEALRALHKSGDWKRIVEPFGFLDENEATDDLSAVCGE